MKPERTVPNLLAMMVYQKALLSTLKKIRYWDEIPRHKYPYPTLYRIEGTKVVGGASDRDLYVQFPRGKLPLDEKRMSALQTALKPIGIEVIYKEIEEEYNYVFCKKGTPMSEIDNYKGWFGFMRSSSSKHDIVQVNINSIKDTKIAEKIFEAVMEKCLDIKLSK